MSPKAYGLVSNTHHSKTCMLKNCTNDRMSCGKRTKWTNSDAEAKKTTFPDEINHVAVCLLPAEAWVSTLMPLTFLKSATEHAVKLNDNSMLYIYVKDQTLDVLWVFFCRKFLPLSLFGYCLQKNPTTWWLHHIVDFFFLTTITFLDIVYRQSSSHWQRLWVSSYRGVFFFHCEPYQLQRINKVGGVSFQTTPMVKITHTHSSQTGVIPQDIPTGQNLNLWPKDWYKIYMFTKLMGCDSHNGT